MVSKTDVSNEKNISNITIAPAILAAFRKGDKESFSEIYQLFYLPLLNFLISILHSSELAEDCCQELFINIWDKRKSLNLDKNFSSYLFTSARNMAIDYLRKQSKYTFVNIEENASSMIDKRYPDDLLITSDTKNILLCIINKMPKQRRKIFILSRFKNISNENIAKKLGVTKNTVEKQIYFAMRDIRGWLAENNL